MKILANMSRDVMWPPVREAWYFKQTAVKSYTYQKI